MRNRPAHKIPQCTARWGNAHCERPRHDGGPHRTQVYDDHGQPTGRVMSWFDRWAA